MTDFTIEELAQLRLEYLQKFIAENKRLKAEIERLKSKKANYWQPSLLKATSKEEEE